MKQLEKTEGELDRLRQQFEEEQNEEGLEELNDEDYLYVMVSTRRLLLN